MKLRTGMMGKLAKLSEARVAWVLPILGVDGNLLYNQPLLESCAARCGEFRVFTAEFKGDDSALGFPVERCGRLWRLYRNERKTTCGVSGYRAGASVMTPAVIASLAKFRPDLLIVNEFSLFSLYAISARKLLGRGHVLLIVEARPRFGSSGWLHWARGIFRRTLVRQADWILTNNQDGKDYVMSDLGSSECKVLASPFLVSDMAIKARLASKDLLDYRASRGQALPVRFLYVGQLVQRKGVQHALEAFARLLPCRIGKFVFDVVGDGPFRKNLERQAKALGLSAHTCFHGKHPYERLWEWYKRSDVFVFPTLADYRALVPFEALSMGMPIMASVYDGGVSETVDPDGNGYFIDPMNVDDLALKLSRFIDTPRFITEFAARSLEMASEYTLDSATETIVRACELALSSCSGLR